VVWCSHTFHFVARLICDLKRCGTMISAQNTSNNGGLMGWIAFNFFFWESKVPGGFSGFRLGVRYSLFWEFTQRRLIVNSRRLRTASRSQLKCQAVQEYCLVLENVTNRLSRNVVNYQCTRCVKSQTSEYHKLLVMNKGELS
jgi:hypothetical protein